ncbi:hypothetical protein HY993_04035 [Candidatus Micrarchaeota archaeon]|nr:hypothetical protein [Candidatus Micrarchaeota archaeon]
MATRKKTSAKGSSKSGSVMDVVYKNYSNKKTSIGLSLAGLFAINAVLAWMAPDVHATLWNWMLLGSVTVTAVETVKLSGVIAGIIAWFLVGYIAASIACRNECCGHCCE